MKQVDLVLMYGSGDGGEARRWVDDARRAIARDLIDTALSTGAFARIIVSTNDPGLAGAANDLGVTVEPDPPDEAFHFGVRLQQIISRYGIERMVYLGGGCAPLLEADTLVEIVARLRGADRLFVANNFYSVDFCGVVPAPALLGADPPGHDNVLGWLCRELGLPAQELERTTATSFDVDTPTDLLALSLHPDVPPHARTLLDGLPLDTRHIASAVSVFVDRDAQVLVCGRVSSRTMAYLERETICRTRVFSEERGMRASGRLSRGEVRSALGMYLEAVGAESFFQDVIPQLGQAAFIDDRVIWAHHGVWPSAEDRFNSDLFHVERIEDTFVRQFTAAALTCPIPVVLGGHSLVSGGLCVLVEAAWAMGGINVQRILRSG
jgi:hypothetical protein